MATKGTGMLSLAYSDRSYPYEDAEPSSATADAASPPMVRPSTDGTMATRGAASVIVPISRIVGRTLRHPIYAVLETIDDGVVATIHDLDLFEHGADEGEALEGLREAFAELCDVLLRDGERLSPELEDQRRFLASILEE